MNLIKILLGGQHGEVEGITAFGLSLGWCTIKVLSLITLGTWVSYLISLSLSVLSFEMGTVMHKE